MSTVISPGTPLTSKLQEILGAEDIVPGSEPSYQICKDLYLYHPLGLKMVESPVAMAMSQRREITVQKGPEERLVEAFEAEWDAIGADDYIFDLTCTSRTYGVSSLALVVVGQDPSEPVSDYVGLWDADVSFSVFDPLNTSGSLVLNQIPTSVDFLKATGVTVQGQKYHPSRTIVMMNGRPIYLGYTMSAFGYVGRSVFQRALYPLKSFVQSMVTDDMVVRKAGLLVAMMKTAGSIVNNAMQWLAGAKRNLLKEAETGNVLSIGIDEKIETLNMQNLDGAYMAARKNILENVAASDDMPAQILNSQTFAEGFGEGVEDAKKVAAFVDRLRIKMARAYSFFDKIVMYRAWNPEFYKALQGEFQELAGTSYEEAFAEWRNSFSATWPNLITEPDSEKSKAEDVKLQAVVKLVEALKEELDPENRARLLEWAADNFNEMKLLFGSTLEFDFEAIAKFAEERQQQAEEMAEAGGPDGEGGEKPTSQTAKRDSWYADAAE